MLSSDLSSFMQGVVYLPQSTYFRSNKSTPAMKAMMISKSGGNDPGGKKPEVKVYSRTIKRNKQGKLDESGSEISSTEMYADDRRRAQAAKGGSGSFDGTVAPRVGGGTPIKKDGPVQGGSKKQIRFSKAKIRRNDASPQAKKAALRALKH